MASERRRLCGSRPSRSFRSFRFAGGKKIPGRYRHGVAAFCFCMTRRARWRERMRESEHECDDVAQLNRWACPCRILLCRARRDGGYAAGKGASGGVSVRARAFARRRAAARLEESADPRHRRRRLCRNRIVVQRRQGPAHRRGDTITIITREASARQCAPDRARADEDLLAALSEITNWRMDPSALVLTGGSRTLRFRTQTN
jgi:META domain